MSRLGQRVYRPLLLLVVMTAFIGSWLPVTGQAQAETDRLLYVLPVEGDIDLGLVPYLRRGIATAHGENAQGVILDINTFGGRVDAATQIRDLISGSPIPVVAYVHNRAWSAGALITLAADHIIMAPGSSMGAAEPRVGDQPADEKLLSALREEFATTAESTGRDPRVAAAMVDADIAIPDVIDQGKLLTLTAGQAVELGMADAVLADYEEILAYLGYGDAHLAFATPTTAEQLARFITNPLISPFLLTIGFTGLVLELYTAGWGVPGTMGLLALALYFGGHLVAGLAGWWVIGLFFLGILLLAMELLVIPGFGVAGVSGIIALVASVFFASASGTQAIYSLLVSLVGTVVLVALFLRYFTKTSRWQRFILSDQESKDQGYVAPAALGHLVGREGETLTPLRPSGTALIDGTRRDVVSEGGFIPVNTQVVVVKVEGPRVVVAPVVKN